MKAIITVGVSGSGKSTWAEQYRKFKYLDEDANNITIINRDETRWAVSGRLGWNGANAYRFDRNTEKQVTAVNHNMMVTAARRGNDVIISDTNLNAKYREEISNYFLSQSYKVEIKEFPISFQEALRRDATRGIYAVGEKVLAEQWEMWVKYWQDKEKELNE